jgi:hypothetical protein
MIELGLFTDEGCIYTSYSRVDIEEEFARQVAAFVEHFGCLPSSDHLRVDTVCPDHEEQPGSYCEECNAEEDEL